MSALGDFLAGAPPRPNPPPSYAERYVAAVGSLFRYDEGRAAEVLRVARRVGADATRYHWGRQPPAARVAPLRSEARAFAEALYLEGLLPPEWADTDAQPWASWGPEPKAGAFCPYEVATLATWAPRLAALGNAHDALVHAAAAWGVAVGPEVSFGVERGDPLTPPFDQEIDGDAEAHVRLCLPATLAARVAIGDSLGVDEEDEDGPGLPEVVDDVGAFAEDVLRLGDGPPGDPRTAPLLGTPRGDVVGVLHSLWQSEEAARRGLTVPDVFGLPGPLRAEVRKVAARGAPVAGRPFSEAPHPAHALLAAFEAGVTVRNFGKVGASYLLRGVAQATPGC